METYFANINFGSWIVYRPKDKSINLRNWQLLLAALMETQNKWLRWSEGAFLMCFYSINI